MSVVAFDAVVRKEVDEDGDVEIEYLRKSEQVTWIFTTPHKKVLCMLKLYF